MQNPDKPCFVRIKTMMEAGSARLIVNIGDLRAYDPQLARDMMTHPLDQLPVFEDVVKEVRGATWRRAGALCALSASGPPARLPTESQPPASLHRQS